jgi:predicted nucleic acid-binding Zn ribbon protein
MPVYVYRVIPTDPQVSEERFEVRQSIHDPPLTQHPETGRPVQRVICAPQIGKSIGNTDIAAAGFTKYKRTSDGSYERLAGGGGPERLDPRGS